MTVAARFSSILAVVTLSAGAACSSAPAVTATTPDPAHVAQQAHDPRAGDETASAAPSSASTAP
ncbi:MAG: hypothetical protein JWP97_6739, partial [Labilithrix sp.]|nr:hypothetical protein [Labilithrix sp.]